MTVPEQKSVVSSTAPKLKGRGLVQWALIVMLAALVAIAAVPSYLGQWPWSAALKVPQIDQLKALKETPLALPGWQVSSHSEVRISGTPWVLSEYQSEDRVDSQINSLALLMRPQPWHDNQPEVEWVDISGSQGWQINDLHRLKFDVSAASNQTATVKMRYFRGLTDQETFAVMQWYAWPTGGDAAPGGWFWADQARQWGQQERLPWVAVSVLFPIEPVGNIRPYTEEAIAIGQMIQASLMDTAFSRS